MKASSVKPRRTTIAGCWILDKTRANWSMNDYLQTMNVDPLAIEAHEKGEKEHDTFHTIEFVERGKVVRIVKRSRVNNDVVVELPLGRETIHYLQPSNRPKRSMATSDHSGHLCIQSSLVTTDHGTAVVTDVKRLQTSTTEPDTNDESGEHPKSSSEEDVVLVQELTIVNEGTGQSHTTIRYFKPYYETPPHLVPPLTMDAMEDGDD